MTLTATALRTLAKPPIGVTRGAVSFKLPASWQGKWAFGPTPANAPTVKVTIGASSALFLGKLDPIRAALVTIERELGDVVAELRAKKLTPPPAGAIVMTANPDVALTGLAPHTILGYVVDERKVAKSFAPLLIPRLPMLPKNLRCHETTFADQFASDVHGTLKTYRKLVGDANIYSVDMAKRCYAPWGAGKKAESVEEKRIRATANLSIHQTAFAIAMTAFTQRLDELALLATDDPSRRAVVIVGGSGGGKGRVMPLIGVGMAKFQPGAVFDAAGEGEARECTTILTECRRRGVHVDFVYLHKPVRAAAVRVVERTTSSGRMVDVLPMVRGHVQGSDVVRAFAESPDLLAQQKLGKARCYGFTAGDEVLDPDPMALKFPVAERLDHEGRLNVPKAELSEAQAVLALLTELAEARRTGGISEDALSGALMGLAVVWPDYFDSLGLKLFRDSASL